jgi:lipoprotein signal peptidase
LKTKNKLQGVSLFLISVGGFSNVIDRMESGSVTDYWKFFDLWYFNLADVLIVMGTMVFISSFLIENEKGN